MSARAATPRAASNARSITRTAGRCRPRPSCDGEEVRYVAFVPARVVYEGERADRARTSTELHEDGFHGYRVDCRDCGTVAERRRAAPCATRRRRCARAPDCKFGTLIGSHSPRDELRRARGGLELVYAARD